ncbi:hypothetical protein F0562_004822 [Nyssa sinensis]|uniref:Uncharacterized protein n=1 Tax=Nyssa sinensis TaxID=561372 RepID=A0A5J5AGI0_9ASTE|nr:hypothetical protein F0562_004822 [Nyssa sinensis]
MGGCVSVHKHSDSAMKLRLSFGSKTENVVIPSPIKDKPIINGDRPIAEVGLKSQWPMSQPVMTFRDFGSKEETFFDSRPWLESDCEDDFFSVNGDFTPSRGNTPVHQSFSMGTLQVSNGLLEDKTPGSKPEPSPTAKKKKLAELFQESLRDDLDEDEINILGNQNGVNGKMVGKTAASDLPQKSGNGTPNVSGANCVCSSTERTPNGDFRPEKEKSIRSAQCCLPNLLSSRSFRERKKKMSPTRSIG